jgi:hypothetical protein
VGMPFDDHILEFLTSVLHVFMMSHVLHYFNSGCKMFGPNDLPGWGIMMVKYFIA